MWAIFKHVLRSRNQSFVTGYKLELSIARLIRVREGGGASIFQIANLSVGAISLIELFRSKCASLATRILESAQSIPSSLLDLVCGQRTHVIVVRLIIRIN